MRICANSTTVKLSLIISIRSSNGITNDDNNVRMTQEIENAESLSLRNASRLTNIEGALNNLISYVNTLSEDVASVTAQLKSLSKNVKIIQDYIVPRVPTDIVAIPLSLCSSAASSSPATMLAKKVLMFKDTNLMKLKHDFTSIRSFLREMTIYTRGEILANKHLDDKEDRYMTIIDGLKNGFVLSEETMNALYPSLKEARNQLTKDVRYLL
ncbi:unnamed protein product [Didymodactylos carnosus]|uniref:Uncharacterized protein n=1 Tax=Didymodactylos carnosus TaxID=1234261 RepID=A0A813XDT9_9BILA|nr:unnamed protein product [Didymodactylos carnosus]CAF0868556.1 unnamed protein product [Didymodactylos carnosus]CAF3598118.1 unnamed protein product [Didymodactylos carnosus]CAF3656023.1 unnamed protein product [Didymodactylos carnosus]